MKLIIDGSRSFNSYSVLFEVMKTQTPWPTAVISGGALGADQLGERWAAEHAIPCRIMKEQWVKYGFIAGARKNEEMARVGDGLVAFWDGRSQGTRHMIETMKALGKPVRVVSI